MKTKIIYSFFFKWTVFDGSTLVWRKKRVHGYFMDVPWKNISIFFSVVSYVIF